MVKSASQEGLNVQGITTNVSPAGNTASAETSSFFSNFVFATFFENEFYCCCCFVLFCCCGNYSFLFCLIFDVWWTFLFVTKLLFTYDSNNLSQIKKKNKPNFEDSSSTDDDQDCQLLQHKTQCDKSHHFQKKKKKKKKKNLVKE